MTEASHLPQVSVVIATFNRPRLLTQTLRTILAQDYPKERFEVLVVDNNSSPPARAVVESFADSVPSPRWILETTPGVSRARNCGIQHARGDIIVFADDDVLAARDWLRKLVEPFHTAASRRIGAVGGTVLPVFPEGCPPWWRYTHPLQLSDRAEPLSSGQERKLMGANLAVTKAALNEVGGFRTDLGRRGLALLDGEEPDLLSRIRAAGFEIWFAGQAVVQHQMPLSRLTLRYACRSAFDSARSRVIDRLGTGSLSRSRRVGYCVARLLGNFMLLSVFLLGAVFCGLIAQIGWAKGFVVRFCRSAGYVIQMVALAINRKT